MVFMVRRWWCWSERVDLTGICGTLGLKCSCASAENKMDQFPRIGDGITRGEFNMECKMGFAKEFKQLGITYTYYPKQYAIL